MKRTEEDIVLKLLHTADWHLGRRFRAFSEEASIKLSRARLEVIRSHLQRGRAASGRRGALRG
jgi:hypothetical protein